MQPTSSSRPAAPGAATLVGAALIIVGVILPWVNVSLGEFGSVSVKGLDTDDGKIAIGIGVILAALGALMIAKRTRGVLLGVGIAALVLGAMQTLFSVINLTDISGEAGESIGASVGIGLYVTLVGSLIALVGGILGIVAARKLPKASAAPPPPGFAAGPPSPAAPAAPPPPGPGGAWGGPPPPPPAPPPPGQGGTPPPQQP